ncbi:MAG: hypothetical protein M1837_007354 [Sclerophora amabilis]|nr:MAG: hypothetical protein M1837_007354 [Sclerophora amabilis]
MYKQTLRRNCLQRCGERVNSQRSVNQSAVRSRGFYTSPRQLAAAAAAADRSGSALQAPSRPLDIRHNPSPRRQPSRNFHSSFRSPASYSAAAANRNRNTENDDAARAGSPYNENETSYITSRRASQARRTIPFHPEPIKSAETWRTLEAVEQASLTAQAERKNALARNNDDNDDVNNEQPDESAAEETQTRELIMRKVVGGIYPPTTSRGDEEGEEAGRNDERGGKGGRAAARLMLADVERVVQCNASYGTREVDGILSRVKRFTDDAGRRR